MVVKFLKRNKNHHGISFQDKRLPRQKINLKISDR
jgi:hypothetical protein